MWEYYPVELSAGTVTFEIAVTNTTSSPKLAELTDRNIDAILLTQNLSNIQARMVDEQQLALDGLFSQVNEVSELFPIDSKSLKLTSCSRFRCLRE